jgi:glycosyltransferase involved in cell wall biosynthesis
MLLRAFAAVAPTHPDWSLDIFGNGSKRAGLQQAVVDLGLQGRASINPATDRLGDRMRDASVYVLSSRYEGFPLVLLEAMAAGLAVVTFDCPTGPGEIVHDGVDGILVPALDVAALAAALDRVISDESLRRRLAKAARSTVRRFSSDAIGRRWDALLGPTPLAVAAAAATPPRTIRRAKGARTAVPATGRLATTRLRRASRSRRASSGSPPASGGSGCPRP